jgi:hypothetical protein
MAGWERQVAATRCDDDICDKARSTIGFLGVEATVWSPWTAALVERLRELGWIDGRTIAIEYRWAEGRAERVAEIAAEFVRLKVDVIVTFGTAVPGVKQATATIPIAIAQDPVGGGLVTSLAQPGGNVTGLSIQSTDVAGKRVELLREVVPRLRRLAIMVDFGNPQPVLEMGEGGAGERRPSSLRKRRLRGCPSWIHIEPCASPRSLSFGVFWRRSGLGLELAKRSLMP